jgi:hypothetical protein
MVQCLSKDEGEDEAYEPHRSWQIFASMPTAFDQLHVSPYTPLMTVGSYGLTPRSR